jgi:Tfp pilus assembly protein PilF
MKKVICEKCGIRRGRRQCLKYNEFICGDCCSTTQLNHTCPKNCIHLGKLNGKDLNDKIQALLEMGLGLREKKPEEAIKLFDRALQLDANNYRTFIEKSSAYEIMGKFDKSIECIEKAYNISRDGSLCINLADLYRKAGEYKKAMEILSGIKEETPKTLFLSGECSFMTEDYDGAISAFIKLLSSPLPQEMDEDRARVTLSKSYLLVKNTDKAIETALTIKKFDTEKNDILEHAYFLGGRMYELLNLLNSLGNIGYGEKFLLLQCAQVLSKDSGGSIIRIIDDLLDSGYFNNNSYKEAWLLGLKIKLLFKELNMSKAYDTFIRNEVKIVSMAKTIPDCMEACSLIGFFIYSIDKKKARFLFSMSADMRVEELILNELYQAFTTMDISPYVRAKAIEKSLKLMKDGRGESFNRTAIAADILFDCGEYTQAAEYLTRIIDRDKPDAIVMYKIGQCLMKQGKFTEALGILKETMNLSRFIPGVNSGIIICSLETGCDWIEYFKVLEIEKLSFNDIFELAQVLQSKGCFDKAGYLYDFIVEKYKGMDIYTRKMVYHNMVAVYRNLKDYHRAMEIITQIPQQYSDQAILIDRGCLYYDTGEYQKASDIFQKLSEEDRTGTTSFNIGIMKMKDHDYASSIDIFNNSIKHIEELTADGGISAYKKYGILLNRLYRNKSLCLLKMGMPDEALLSIEKAYNILRDGKTLEILSVVQSAMLDSEKNIKPDEMGLDSLTDGCLAIDREFTDEIRAMLERVLNNAYGEDIKKTDAEQNSESPILNFVKYEIEAHQKDYESIERSEGAFQRYLGNLMSSFNKQVIQNMDEITGGESQRPDGVFDTAKRLMDIGDKLYRDMEYTGNPRLIYASLMPYYTAVKMMSRDIIYPYYKKSMDKLPIPKDASGFKNIGIYNYNYDNQVYYRVDFSYNISISSYLFEINCHPALRSQYINFKKHYMPWNKFVWILSGMRKKWDIVDDIRSAGLLLLFYTGFKNHLGIQGDLDSGDIIVLSGDLIQISNERDYSIKSMLHKVYDLDYINQAASIRETAHRCMDSLIKIRRLE